MMLCLIKDNKKCMIDLEIDTIIIKKMDFFQNALMQKI